ncbi:hypothetical protein BD779DRAFT_1475194 [Infundibulicybe gibba]|nr:hypothetical protein BD779DRAFT_1475194 [Infundibulicybe gibba]
MSSREDGSTTSAYQNRGSCVNVSVDVTGPGEATLPTLKERKYSEVHDTPGGAVGAEGDVVSTTAKHWSASRQPCGLPIEAQLAIQREVLFKSTNIPESSPSAMTTGQRSSGQILSAVSENPRASCPPTAAITAFKCPCGNECCRLHSLIPFLQRLRTAGDLGDQVFGSYQPAICRDPDPMPTPAPPGGFWGFCDPATRCDPDLMPAIDLIITRLKQGGRLIYIGAGASGCSLGVLDAAELRASSPHLLPPSSGIVTSRNMAYVPQGCPRACTGVLTIGITYTKWSAPGDPGFVLIKLSKKLGEYTRTSEGMVQTGAPDKRDNGVASIANFRTTQSIPKIPNVVHAKTGSGATVTKRERSESPVLPLEDRYDTTTSNQEPAC